jgi:hypothetical protein
MREGILNEPVRESAERLLKTFGDQMNLGFTHMIFVAVSPEGEFRTANYSTQGPLHKEAVKQIAAYLDRWADQFEDGA